MLDGSADSFIGNNELKIDKKAGERAFEAYCKRYGELLTDVRRFVADVNQRKRHGRVARWWKRRKAAKATEASRA